MTDDTRGIAHAQLRHGAVLVGLATLLLALTLLSMGIGRYPVEPARAAAILLSKIVPIEPFWTDVEGRIVLLLRGPRILMAAACGAGLAMSGAALQGVFRNPLVSPHILGVSSGASLGGALAILAGLGAIATIGSAFAAGASALVLVGLLARTTGGGGTVAVVLTGVIVAAFFSAFVSLVITLADPETSLPGIVFWLMGSFATSTPAKAAIAVPALLGTIFLLNAVRFRINVLSLGEDDARALGLRVARERWTIFVAVALVEATVVSFAGVVGWVGLVVPHGARALVGADHRVLLPASALLGASYLVAIDTIARSLTAAEIPLGVLTAIVGAPVFAFILRRRQKAEVGA